MPAGRTFNREITLKRILGLFVGIDEYNDQDLSGLRSVEPTLKLFEIWGGKKRDDRIINMIRTGGHGEHQTTENENETKTDPGLKFVLLTSPKIEGSLLSTRVNIFAGLSFLHNKAEKGDLLIIYLSGQGRKIYNEFNFFPADAIADVRYSNNSTPIFSTDGTGIALNELLKSFSPLAKKGVKVLLITDACHAGAVSFDISEYSGVSGGGISCLFSSTGEENAAEDRNGGIFSNGLIEGLKGAADMDNKGYITLRDLYDFAYLYVKKNGVGVRQHPLLIGTLESGTIVKVLNKEEQAYKGPADFVRRPD